MSVSKRVSSSGTITWLARVFRDEDPLTGKQTVVAKSFKTQKEAKAWESATRKQVGEGVYQEPVKVTLAEFFAE